ncbi:MAG: putative membrane protein [Rickettsiales bacterium]|jgi:uncharacterized membrane protein
MKLKLNFNWEDASQIVVGAFALSVPIAFSEEAWNAGESLPMVNLLLVILLTISFLGFYAYQGIFQHNIKARILMFIFRIVAAYLITLVVVALVLLSLNKFHIMTDSITAIKTVVIISMPASIGAIIVDSIDKE